MHTLEVYTTRIPRTRGQKRLKRAKDEGRRTHGSRMIYLRQDDCMQDFEFFEISGVHREKSVSDKSG